MMAGAFVSVDVECVPESEINSAWQNWLTEHLSPDSQQCSADFIPPPTSATNNMMSAQDTSNHSMDSRCGDAHAVVGAVTSALVSDDDAIPVSDNGDINNPICTRVLVDSGANICAAPPALAMLLKLPVHEWPTPIVVTFGNKSTAMARYYIYLGNLLGRTAIIENCAHTVLSTPALNRRGYDVLMGSNMRCSIFNDDGVFADVPITQGEELYFLDVYELLKIKTPTPHKNQPHIAVHNATHKKRVGKIKVCDVVKLHDRLQHAASPAVMARAIRFGAWLGVNVLPSDVEQVYKHQQCLSCLLGKANRLPRSEGSGIKPNIFGEELSADFKPVTPVSICGHIGFYFFLESSKGYKVAVMTKVHDGEHFLEACKFVSALYKKYNNKVSILRFDAGRVEGASEVSIQLGSSMVSTLILQHLSVSSRIHWSELSRQPSRAWAPCTVVRILLATRHGTWHCSHGLLHRMRVPMS
jgi:hypothetical protein